MALIHATAQGRKILRHPWRRACTLLLTLTSLFAVLTYVHIAASIIVGTDGQFAAGYISWSPYSSRYETAHYGDGSEGSGGESLLERLFGWFGAFDPEPVYEEEPEIVLEDDFPGIGVCVRACACTYCVRILNQYRAGNCLLYTSDAADD